MSDNDAFDNLPTGEKPVTSVEGKKDNITMDDVEASNKTSPKINNVAPFFDRQKILIVGFAVILLLVLIFGLLGIGKKKESEEDYLDKKGLSFVPDFVENWNPQVVIEKNADTFKTGSEENTTPVVMQEQMSDEEADEVMKTIPLSDESKAPIHTSGSSASQQSSVPITNRNEQQKAVRRMPMNTSSSDDAAISIAPQTQSQQSRFSNQRQSVQDYAQQVQNRMSNLIGGMGGTGSEQNSYANQNMQNNKQAFNSAGVGNIGMQFNNETSLYTGTIIPAVLVTGINTDLPGVVIARVTSNVYSSLNGKHLLIPSGSQLLATYNSSVSYGQNRVQVAWNKLIRPDGLEINLGNMNGVDSQGYSGYKGSVDNHYFEYAKAIGLIAVFSAIDNEVEAFNETSDNWYLQNIANDVYSSTNKVANKMIDRALDIQPTIKIKQGAKINIITNVTFSLPPVENISVTQKYIRQQ